MKKMNISERKSSVLESKEELGNILTNLMKECDIDDAKLSRITEIPASTISRLRLNPDANPTAATLRPIAKFFNISISQLLGDEPLPKDRLPGTHNPVSFTSSRIPIINWEWITEWIENDRISFTKKLIKWVSTEKEVSSRTFSLIIPTDSFGIAFRKGSLVIVDPERHPLDGDLVLLKTSEEENILLRQLLKDGNDLYIRSVNPEMKGTRLLEENHQFIGVIIEARFSLRDETHKSKLESSLNLVDGITRLQEAT